MLLTLGQFQSHLYGIELLVVFSYLGLTLTYRSYIPSTSMAFALAEAL